MQLPKAALHNVQITLKNEKFLIFSASLRYTIPFLVSQPENDTESIIKFSNSSIKIAPP